MANKKQKNRLVATEDVWAVCLIGVQAVGLSFFKLFPPLLDMTIILLGCQASFCSVILHF